MDPKGAEELPDSAPVEVEAVVREKREEPVEVVSVREGTFQEKDKVEPEIIDYYSSEYQQKIRAQIARRADERARAAGYKDAREQQDAEIKKKRQAAIVAQEERARTFREEWAAGNIRKPVITIKPPDSTNVIKTTPQAERGTLIKPPTFTNLFGAYLHNRRNVTTWKCTLL